MLRPVIYKQTAVDTCLTAICVADTHRGRGIGKQLVKSLELFLVDLGIRAYRLETLAKNNVSRTFYKNLFFVEHETRGRNVILVKDLCSDPNQC